MQRYALEKLKTWNTSKNRKPLIIRGARQVGKTWLVEEFARQSFKHFASINFLNNEIVQQFFSGSLEPKRTLAALGAYTNTNLLDGETLLFLDEIQECPRAITALKMFCEQTPQIPVIAAGSLLGVALNRDDATKSMSRISWPVGKVDYLDLFPMTFSEFLRALGDNSLADLIIEKDYELISAMGESFEDRLRSYLYVGGMPAAVQAYISTGLLSEARQIQDALLIDYEHDFSKHISSPLEAEHIRETWRSVPLQIARENGSKKFIYSQVRPGGRGRDYKDAISWLADAGLVTKVNRITRPGVPLSAYTDPTSFKLYLLDVGLLGAALHLNEKTLFSGDALFTHAKGTYSEQFVCQQLIASKKLPAYWSADGKQSKNEIDFICEHNGEVIPLEVKAGINVKSKSLAQFAKEFSLSHCIRFSLAGYEEQGWMKNLPLYAAESL
ncbi:ATP-binding protein [Atopobium fossor]|uniref:ATP-binding protein n=1 Tax=Atopobium fossor TaxID=39487 RepID=UPI00041BA400|nr:ATP-binding protein [Atopobium fossor]